MMRTPLFDVLPSLRPVVRSAALLGGALLLAVGLARPAQAQSPSPTATGPALETGDAPETVRGRWTDHFDEQIAHELRTSPSERERTALLRTFVNVVVQEETTVDVSAAVPALLRVVTQDADPQRRLLALQALDLVGPERMGDARYRSAMVRLSARVQDEPSVPVRRAIASMLSTYQAERPVS